MSDQEAVRLQTWPPEGGLVVVRVVLYSRGCGRLGWCAERRLITVVAGFDSLARYSMELKPITSGLQIMGSRPSTPWLAPADLQVFKDFSEAICEVARVSAVSFTEATEAFKDFAAALNGQVLPETPG